MHIFPTAHPNPKNGPPDDAGLIPSPRLWSPGPAHVLSGLSSFECGARVHLPCPGSNGTGLRWSTVVSAGPLVVAPRSPHPVSCVVSGTAGASNKLRPIVPRQVRQPVAGRLHCRSARDAVPCPAIDNGPPPSPGWAPDRGLERRCHRRTCARLRGNSLGERRPIEHIHTESG